VVQADLMVADNGLGDVVYLHVLGLGLVFLNSPDAAFDLLDKRGSIYSDKPALVMAGELCVFFGLMPVVIRVLTFLFRSDRCGCKNMVRFHSIPSSILFHRANPWIATRQ